VPENWPQTGARPPRAEIFECVSEHKKPELIAAIEEVRAAMQKFNDCT
jgi:hypothetical protein